MIESLTSTEDKKLYAGNLIIISSYTQWSVLPSMEEANHIYTNEFTATSIVFNKSIKFLSTILYNR